MPLVEVETVRLTVELDRATTFAGGRENLLDVDIMDLARADQAPRRVSQHGKMPMSIARNSLSVCSSRGRPKGRMHGPDGEIEPAQDGVRQVELSILENVDLGGTQYHCPGEGLVQMSDLVDLLSEALGVELMSDRHPLAMICDCQVGVAALLGRLRHLRQRASTIARLGVEMQISANVGEA